MAGEIGLGVAGFLAGLTQAIERINQQNRQEQFQLLQLGERSGRFQIAPVAPGQAQGGNFLQRLIGGSPYAPQNGQPVLPFGGGAVTLQPVQTAASLPPGVLKALKLDTPEAAPLLANVPAQQLLPAYFQALRDQDDAGLQEEELRQSKLLTDMLAQARRGPTGERLPQTEDAGPGAPAPVTSGRQTVAPTPRPAPAAGPTIQDRVTPRIQEIDAELAELNPILRQVTGLGGKSVQPRIQALQRRYDTLTQERENLQKRLDARSSNIREATSFDMFGRPFGSLSQDEVKQVNAAVERKELAKEERHGLAAAERQARAAEYAAGRQAKAIENAAEKSYQTELARSKAEREFREGVTLLEAEPKEESTKYFYTDTGEQVSQAEPFKDVKEFIKANKVRKLDDKSTDAWVKTRQILPVLAELRSNIETIYGPGGVFDRLPPGIRSRGEAAIQGYLNRAAQTDPVLAVTLANIKGNAELLNKSLRGAVGVQTEGDVNRALSNLPKLDGVPDTQAVAYRKLNSLFRQITEGARSTFQNRDFTIPALQPLSIRQPGTTQADEDLGALGILVPK